MKHRGIHNTHDENLTVEFEIINAKWHIKREEYQGGSFNGNDCRKLLKNVHILEQSCPFRGYVEAFNAFNGVVESCYSTILLDNYKQKIEEFRQKYITLKISVTPKIHAVFFHVAEFCEIVQTGLGPWSEQTAESLHHDFGQMWKNFKVDIDHPEYAKRLYDAVVMYNSQHL